MTNTTARLENHLILWLLYVDRGKRVIVSLDRKFAVADHDHTKCSVVPSVVMVCSIPHTIEESFYRGRVFVGIKDCLFEPSSPIRHATELNKILDSPGSTNAPILLLYSDGGPDHRLTYLTAQISYIHCMPLCAAQP